MTSLATATRQHRDLGPFVTWAHDAVPPVRCSEDSEATFGVMPGRSRVLVSDAAFQQKKVIELIRQLPPACAAWLRVAYVANDFKDIEVVTVHCWELFEQERPAMISKTRERCKSMVFLAQQEAVRLANGRDRLHKPADLQRLMGVSESSWRKDWKWYWEGLLDSFLFLDAEALFLLYESMPDSVQNTYGRWLRWQG